MSISWRCPYPPNTPLFVASQLLQYQSPFRNHAAFCLDSLVIWVVPLCIVFSSFFENNLRIEILPIANIAPTTRQYYNLQLYLKFQMVLIQYKKSEKNSFTIEATGNTPVSAVIAHMLEINNMRILVNRLYHALEQLATKGVLKPQELQGLSWEDVQKHPEEIKNLSEDKIMYASKPIAEAPYRYVADKNNARYGLVLPKEEADVILRQVEIAKKGLEAKNGVTTKEELEELVDGMRGAVMLTYPGYFGLPEWEPVVLILQNRVDTEVLSTEEFQCFQEDANLWWAGKEMVKNKPLSEYSGPNEKTKIIVKLQNQGAQQPAREPPIDTVTYRKMIEYYHKKTNQNKEFDKQAVGAIYQNPEWANKKLKEEMTIGKPISYKPF